MVGGVCGCGGVVCLRWGCCWGGRGRWLGVVVVILPSRVCSVLNIVFGGVVCR